MTPPQIYTGPERRTPLVLQHPHSAAEPCPGGCKDLDEVAKAISKTYEDLDDFELRMQVMRDELTRIETRLDEGSARMGRIEVLIADNAGAMTRNTSDTAEILHIMRDSQAALRIIGHFGNVLKWGASILLPLTALWYLFKDHGK